MAIDPKTLPDGTIVEATHHGYTGFQPIEATDYTLKDVEVVRVFVPVPDGMDVETATRILTDHVQWVPLPGSPTKSHEGCRIRAVGDTDKGICYSVPLKVEHCDTVSVGGVLLNPRDAKWSWFIHRDDMPADRDAELVEAMAKGLFNDDILTWDDINEPTRDHFRTYASRALAALREFGA